MRRTAVLASAVAGGFLSMLALAPSVAAADLASVGADAPKFTLPAQDNKPVSLSDYKGKWVVLYFYPKDQTSGCSKEAHKFQDALPQFDAKNAVILGVSVDTVDSHKQFCTKDSLTFHLLADPDHKVVSAYGSLGGFAGITIANRNTFLIDPHGKIAQEWVKVNPNTAASDVLAALP